jgi:diguanylate cyclase (GGDEF)-like protein
MRNMVLSDSVALDNRSSIQSDVAILIENATLRAEVSGLKARIRELEWLADADPALPVANRRALLRELEREIAFARRNGASAAFIYIDVNRLKLVNDQLGHAAGDALLLHVATTLNEALQSSHMVARLGGDELAIILPDTTEEQAQTVAQQLAAAVAANRVAFSGGSFLAGIAAGATSIRAEDSVTSLISRADAAMYAGKVRRLLLAPWG